MLFAQPSTYTASAVMEGDEQLLSQMRSAGFGEELALAAEQAPAIRRRQRSYPDELPVAAQLADHFAVRPDAQPGRIRLAFTHADPAIAALVVDLAAQQAMQSGPDSAISADRAPELADLEAAELALQQFRAANPEVQRADQRAEELSRELLRTEKAAADLEGRVEDLSVRLRRIDGGDLEPLSTHSGVTRIRQQLERLVVQQQKLASRYGPGHRKMIDADAEVAAAQALLDAEVATARRRLAEELEARRAEQAGRVAELRRLRSAQDALGASLTEQQGLELKLAQAQRRYSSSGSAGTALQAKAAVPTAPDDRSQLAWLAILFLATSVLIFLLQWLLRR